MGGLAGLMHEKAIMVREKMDGAAKGVAEKVDGMYGRLLERISADAGEGLLVGRVRLYTVYKEDKKRWWHTERMLCVYNLISKRLREDHFAVKLDIEEHDDKVVYYAIVNW